MNKTRQEIVDEAVRIRRNIKQYFEDFEFWRDVIRDDNEPIFDPDPNGQMQRIAAGIDKMLENERRAGLVTVPDIVR